MDRVLFGITIFGCALGIAQIIRMGYIMGFKKKEN